MWKCHLNTFRNINSYQENRKISHAEVHQHKHRNSKTGVVLEQLRMPSVFLALILLQQQVLACQHCGEWNWGIEKKPAFLLHLLSGKANLFQQQVSLYLTFFLIAFILCGTVVWVLSFNNNEKIVEQFQSWNAEIYFLHLSSHVFLLKFLFKQSQKSREYLSNVLCCIWDYAWHLLDIC